MVETAVQSQTAARWIPGGGSHRRSVKAGVLTNGAYERSGFRQFKADIFVKEEG